MTGARQPRPWPEHANQVVDDQRKRRPESRRGVNHLSMPPNSGPLNRTTSRAGEVCASVFEESRRSKNAAPNRSGANRLLMPPDRAALSRRRSRPTVPKPNENAASNLEAARITYWCLPNVRRSTGARQAGAVFGQQMKTPPRIRSGVNHLLMHPNDASVSRRTSRATPRSCSTKKPPRGSERRDSPFNASPPWNAQPFHVNP